MCEGIFPGLRVKSTLVHYNTDGNECQAENGIFTCKEYDSLGSGDVSDAG